jgi:hypothetical protein
MNNLPDQKREVSLVEHRHLGNSTFSDERKFAGENIDQSSQDKYISHEGGGAQFRKVAYERERQENNELHQDEILDGNDLCAVREGHDESLQRMSVPELEMYSDNRPSGFRPRRLCMQKRNPAERRRLKRG